MSSKQRLIRVAVVAETMVAITGHILVQVPDDAEDQEIRDLLRKPSREVASSYCRTPETVDRIVLHDMEVVEAGCENECLTVLVRDENGHLVVKS